MQQVHVPFRRQRDDGDRVRPPNAREEHVHEPAEEIGVIGGAGNDIREAAKHVEPVRSVAEGEPVEFVMPDGAFVEQRAIVAGRNG